MIAGAAHHDLRAEGASQPRGLNGLRRAGPRHTTGVDRRRRSRSHLRRARRRRPPPAGTTSSTPPRAAGSGIRRARRRAPPPHRRSSPSPPRSTARRSSPPPLEVLQPLALVGRGRCAVRRRRGPGACRSDRTSGRLRRRAARSRPSPRRTSADAAAAAERAFTTVGALADVLLAGLHTPLSRTGTGAVSAVDRRRLTDAGALGSAEDIDDLVAAAEAADLVTPLGREWIVTDAGMQWLEATTTRRWAIVAEGLRDALPPGLRTADGGFRPLGELGGRLPAARRVDRARRPAAPHRRGVGTAHAGRHRAGVDRVAARRRAPRHRRARRAPSRRDRSRLPAGRPDRDRAGSARAAARPAPAHDRDPRVARAGVDLPLQHRVARRRA